MATVATTQGGIRLQLLGEPKLDLGTDAFPLERKDAALFALVAIDGAIPRSKAAALLWPDVDEDAARNNLRQRLHRLRKRAGQDVALTTADVLRLADGVSHDLNGVAAMLAQDVSTATGELLGSLDYADCQQLDEWLQAAREKWRATRRSALAEIASKLEREGHIALALQYGERLLADDPLREHAHRQLMRLHYLRGDRAAALAAFDRCRELLKRELNTIPGNETLELAALVESSGALPSPAAIAKPVSVLRPPKLVGRDTEWSELEIAWQHGRLALVCGEPGIGKTRLLGDFVARHDGAIVIGARPGDERVPFALLARLLRAVTQRFTPILEDWAKAELSRLLPELGAAPESKLQPLRLQRAVSQALLMASKAGLTACAIDDLHFADDASVESLLALTAEERHVRWLVGVRAAEMPRRLLEWLERTESNEVARIELAPLDVSAIETLLVSLALPDFDAHAWAEPLARHTGGNPLFILETLSAVLAQDATALRGGVALLPAPGSVGQLIERRLHKLSRDALRLARVAALAGQDFSVQLAARVLCAHPLDLAEGWHELEVAQIIRADGESSAFAHDLILETTLRTVPHAIARVMHKDIAEFLEAHGAQPARIAGHYYEAEQWSKAGAQYRMAADRARSIAFGADAAELYQHAADSFEKAGQRTERLDAMHWHGTCLHFMKRFSEYAAVAQKMSSLAVTPHERLWALTALAKSRFEITHDDESIRLMRDARLLSRELGDTPNECSLAEWEALALSFRGRQQEALEVGKTLRAFIEANPQDTEMAMRRRQYAYLLEMDNQFERAIDFADAAIVRARADGNLGLVSETLVIRGACLYNLGHVDAAIDEYHAARRLQIEGAGGTVAWTTYDIMLGRYLQEAARYREAHQILASVLEGHGSAEGKTRG